MKSCIFLFLIFTLSRYAFIIIDAIVRIKEALEIGIPAMLANTVDVNIAPVNVETPDSIPTILLNICCFLFLLAFFLYIILSFLIHLG